jgi:hypothetical protein
MHPHVFKVKLLHSFYNKKLIHFLLLFLDLLQLLDFYDKVYNPRFVHFQNQFPHYHLHNKSPNIKLLFHEVFKFFYEHVVFYSSSSLIFHFPFF